MERGEEAGRPTGDNRQKGTKVLRIQLLVTLVVTAPAAVLVAQPPAVADACVGTANHAWRSDTWAPDDVTGIRAPVRLRKSGDVCVPGSGDEGDQASVWIAIEPQTSDEIVQLGFVHVIDDPGTGSTKFCRFWAIGGGAVHAYNCGNDSGGDQVWFRIKVDTPGPPDTNKYYYLQDCGKAGGYTSCVTKNSNQGKWGHGWALASSEVSHACQTVMMGSSTNKANAGTGTYPIEMQTTVGGAWVSGTLSGASQGPVCSFNYKYDAGANVFTSWDARN